MSPVLAADLPTLWKLFLNEVTVLDDPAVQATGRVPTLLGFLEPEEFIVSETPKLILTECGVDITEWQRLQKVARPRESKDVLLQELLETIASAVKEFNATGWVHGDLGATNVRVSSRRGKSYVTLIDFGSSSRWKTQLDYADDIADACAAAGEATAEVFEIRSWL